MTRTSSTRTRAESARPGTDPRRAAWRAWVRRAFPLADGVTYLYAAAVLGSTWGATEALDRLAATVGAGR